MKKGALLLLLLLLAWAGFSQEVGNERPVLFVSKLKAQADESRILVTWRNPNNFTGSILVYRHTAEIDQDNLSNAVRIARLAAQHESYEDTPPDNTPYFYAVLIEEPNGTIQKLIIPFRNKTSEGVRISVPPPTESTAARITDIRAVVSGDSVHVDFQTSNAGRELLLFRGNTPMSSTEDLLEAFAPVQLEAGIHHFVDFPIPGVESYYAVVDAEMFKLGKQVLVAGQNTTSQGVTVPLEVSRVALPPLPDERADHEAGKEQSTEGKPEAPRIASTPAQTIPPGRRTDEPVLASTPLPYLQPLEDRGAGFSIPEQKADLDPETAAAVSRILSSTPPVQAVPRTVVILPEDRDQPVAGESTGLYKILQDYLSAGDYAGAEAKLLGFLNIRRSPYTEARVRFYLAQAYYFQGLYEEALLEFVLAQGALYAPVQPWLESCFRNLWHKQ